MDYSATMISAQAVDCLQLDVTRCGGYTGGSRPPHVAEAHQLQISAHCAPSLHAAVAVLRSTFVTWSTSTTTPGSNRSWSRVRHRSTTVHYTPMPDAEGHGMTVSTQAEKYRTA